MAFLRFFAFCCILLFIQFENVLLSYNDTNIPSNANINNDFENYIEAIKNIKDYNNRKCLNHKNDYKKNYYSSISNRKSALSYLKEFQMQPLRIHFDYTFTLPYEERMLKDLIIPPVKNFFQNLLSVKRNFGKIRFPKYMKTCQGIPIPKFLYTQGTESDLVIIITTYKGLKKYFYDKSVEDRIRNNKIIPEKISNRNRRVNPRNKDIESNNFKNFLKKFFYNNSTKNIDQEEHIKNNFTNNKEHQIKSENIFKNFSLINDSNIIHEKKDKTDSKTREVKNDHIKNKAYSNQVSSFNEFIWETNDGPSDMIGWGSSCLQDLFTLRPIGGALQYVRDIVPTPRDIEDAIWATLHEITHILGMDHHLFSDFVDSNFSQRNLDDIIIVESKLLGLSEMLQERKDMMHDNFTFFNSDYFPKLNNFSQYKPKKISQEESFLRSVIIENKIVELDKAIFKQIEFNEESKDIFDSENKNENYDDYHSQYNIHSYHNYVEKVDDINKQEQPEIKKGDSEASINFGMKKGFIKNINLNKDNHKNAAMPDETEDLNKNFVDRDKNQLQFRKNSENSEDDEINDILNNHSDLEDKKKEENLGKQEIKFNLGINNVFKMTDYKNNSLLVFPEEQNDSDIIKKNSKDKRMKSSSTETFEFRNDFYNSNDEQFLNTSFSKANFNNFYAILQNINYKMPKMINLSIQENYVNIPVSNVNLTFLLMHIENFSENTKILIKSPKVLEVAKDYFACDSIKGVELEHLGGLGSAYSHWSKKILNTEYMISDSHGEKYISNFTLALLEDSGWYKVDYSKSQEMKWGKNKGCKFINGKCINKKIMKKFLNFKSEKTEGKIYKRDFNEINNFYQSSFEAEFCTSFSEEICSLSHVFRAHCGLKEYKENVPNDYKYFDNPQLGGSSHFGDYCPIPEEWIDPNNFTPIGSCRNGIQIREKLGEKICENCRCFISSLIHENFYNQELKRKDKKYKYLDADRAACYETKCKIIKNKVTLIIFVEDTEIICPRKGGILTIDSYKGFINCPNAEDVCTGTLNPFFDYPHDSAYNLFTHLSDRLIHIIYNFVFSLFHS